MEKKVYGKPVYWMSANGNIAVVYNQFGLGSRYSVYRKSFWEENGRLFMPTWEYVISFTFVGEATEYAKRINDMPNIRYPGDGLEEYYA